MHDIGKISMPEHVIDKATKLEKIFDRVHLIEQRFEVLKRDKEIEYLKNLISKEEFENSIKELNEDFEFIKKSNLGGEFMLDEDVSKLENIFKQSLITQDEFYNLSIKKGTLTKEDIDIIRNHAYLSLDMISGLPFPKKYKDVLNIACNHHEKLNGLGYPRGLKESQITLEDRIMILADIFEALTSSSRPYKDAMKLSLVKNILNGMAQRGELDESLIKFFFEHDVFKQYAHEELKIEQLDSL